MPSCPFCQPGRDTYKTPALNRKKRSSSPAHGAHGAHLISHLQTHLQPMEDRRLRPTYGLRTYLHPAGSRARGAIPHVGGDIQPRSRSPPAAPRTRQQSGRAPTVAAARGASRAGGFVHGRPEASGHRRAEGTGRTHRQHFHAGPGLAPRGCRAPRPRSPGCAASVSRSSRAEDGADAGTPWSARAGPAEGKGRAQLRGHHPPPTAIASRPPCAACPALRRSGAASARAWLRRTRPDPAQHQHRPRAAVAAP